MLQRKNRDFYRLLLEGGLFITLTSLPLYLLRLKILWVPVSVLEVEIYILFVIWLAYQFKTKKLALVDIKSRAFLRWALPIGLIFVGLTLSTIFSVDLSLSAGIWKGWFVSPLLLFVVVIDQVKEKAQLKSILTALLLSATVVSLVSLMYWTNKSLTFDGRLAGIYLSPNHLGMYLAPIFLLSIYLGQGLKSRLKKISLFTLQLVMLFVIYLTTSYGTWLALAGALAFLFVFALVRLKQSRAMVAMILLLLVGFALWQMPTQKFQDILHSPRSSWQSRVMVWQSAAEIIKDHSFLGIGPGMFQKYYLDYQYMFEPYLEWAVTQPHNIFLAFWLQAGILGLIGFIWLIIVFFRSLLKKMSDVSVIVMATMIYLLLHGLIDTLYWKNDLAVIWWLVIALAIVCQREVFQRSKLEAVE